MAPKPKPERAPAPAPRPSVMEHVSARRSALYAADTVSQPGSYVTTRRSGNYIPPISVKDVGYVSRGEIPYH